MNMDELERENALKLKQILDLEDALYATRIIDLDDGSPCWCVMPHLEPSHDHDDFCKNARQKVEHMWTKKEDQS